MSSIAEVIGWKFNNQQGMSTVAGVITAFPGGIPLQADQDTWTVEYELYLAKKIKTSSVGSFYTSRLFTGITFNLKSFNCSDASVGAIAAKLENLKRENASTTRTITGVSLTNPVTVTSVAHGFRNLDRIDHSGVGGTVELVGIYTIGNVTSDTYELTGVDGTLWTAFTTGGSAAVTCEWTSIDNTINDLSSILFTGLVNAMNNYTELCFRTARTHKNAINALTTPIDVTAYDISLGWPGSTY